jgi:hypothetical protein
VKSLSASWSGSWWDTEVRHHAARIVAAVAAALIIALGGYLVGKHQSPVTVVTGVAAVGDHEATVTAGGWSYGIQGDVPFWIDSQGGMHDGGWPSCLNLGQRQTVTIRVVPASLPGVMSWRQVVWVDCRS